MLQLRQRICCTSISTIVQQFVSNRYQTKKKIWTFCCSSVTLLFMQTCRELQAFGIRIEQPRSMNQAGFRFSQMRLVIISCVTTDDYSQKLAVRQPFLLQVAGRDSRKNQTQNSTYFTLSSEKPHSELDVARVPAPFPLRLGITTSILQLTTPAEVGCLVFKKHRSCPNSGRPRITYEHMPVIILVTETQRL